MNLTSFRQVEIAMTKRLSLLLIILSGLSALLCLSVYAPVYLTCQGYPLDDAWIHAVYARELAHSGKLAYNPGIPATGCTSPLWAICLSLPHVLFKETWPVITASKAIGFLFHLLTALVLFLFLEDAGSRIFALFGASLVALHPDLIAASVSGMEIPLATFMASMLFYSANKKPWLYGMACFLASLARPELTTIALAIPGAIYLSSRKKLYHPLVASLLGCSLAWGWVVFRNLSISHQPFPATFYAKVGSSAWPVLRSLVKGFDELFSQIVIINSSFLILGTLLFAARLTFSPRAELEEKIPAWAFLGGLGYCALSFLLIPPVDPNAFYHQRYILPAVPLIVAPAFKLINLTLAKLNWSSPKRTAVGLFLAILAFFSLLLKAPQRFERLANDARNIDDVQVSLGLYLSRASADDIAWAVDAGASRYFGRAFVVDLMGLNNFQLLSPQAQAFLETHPASFIEVVPGWNSLDENSQKSLSFTLFQPSTRYSVTSFQPMQLHFLYQGKDGHHGLIFFKGKNFAFRTQAPRMSRD